MRRLKHDHRSTAPMCCTCKVCCSRICDQEDVDEKGAHLDIIGEGQLQSMDVPHTLRVFN
ncbi:hypothetical protein KIN20_033313 [Parelaphostrongylus tenuis]|uniref:Uncharacterized protein n=1 Tax=Parelaphostrongylus tenuis TaxID=148309 RepID=A0AAD5R8D9_PARTN|nr:hypothetical protein KIN20_033313 [Parelaphostrongylus tenuis]